MEIDQFYFYCWGDIPSEPQDDFLGLIMDKSKPRIISTAGAQTGKSRACATAVVYLAIFFPNTNIILVSAQHNWIYHHVCTIFDTHPEFQEFVITRGTEKPIPKYGFALTNGSMCHLCSSTEPSIKGAKADFVFMDEAAEIPKAIYLQCLDRVTGEWSKLVLISTARGKHDRWFLELIDDRKKKGWEWITWSAEDCPWHRADILAYKKKEYGPLRYKIEVQGSIPGAKERLLFPDKQLEDAVKEQVLSEGFPREAGLDFGFSVGTIALCVIERAGGRIKVLFSKEWERTPYSDIVEEIAKILENFNVKLVKADTNPEEYRGILDKYTKIPIMYLPMQFHKEKSLGQLTQHFRQGQMEIPSGMIKLRLQLRRYRKGKRAGDDEVDALCMAQYLVKEIPKKKGIVRFTSDV